MAAMKQGINVSVVSIVGLVGVLIMVNLVLGVQAWYNWSTDRLMADRNQNGRDRDLRMLSEEQIGNVSQVRFTDDSKQTVALPIATAMDMWLDANANRSTEQANQKTPATQPAPATQSATQPAQGNELSQQPTE